MKKRILALLLALTLLVPGGCTVRDTVQIVESSVTTLQELADAALSEETEAPESGEQFVTAEDPEVTQTADTVGEHGYYYDAEHVVLYLDTYGHLPDNYMTKEEARALGWEGGSVEAYQAGAAIGGDRFGNREGLLPEETGRTYTECDINTLGADSRGAERLIFSNDRLYFYCRRARSCWSIPAACMTRSGHMRKSCSASSATQHGRIQISRFKKISKLFEHFSYLVYIARKQAFFFVRIVNLQSAASSDKIRNMNEL